MSSYGNPYKKRELKKKDLLKYVKNVHEVEDGRGMISNTMQKSNLGSVSQGQWIGDENALLDGELPQLYTAVAMGEVRAYEVILEDLKFVMPKEMVHLLTEKAYDKLFAMREKFMAINERRNKIEKMDLNSAFKIRTVNHMQSIYPSSNLHYQKRANIMLSEKARSNPFKIMSMADSRRESHNKNNT
jgi:hypothetical protein